MKIPKFSDNDIDRIIEMAWEDRTPFESIFSQFTLNEKQLISIMRKHLNSRSFKNWRERVKNRKTKHEKLRNFSVGKFHCPTQDKRKRNQ